MVRVAPGSTGAGWLVEHLDALKQAVVAWLERSHYESAPEERQRAMRKQALVPDVTVGMPEPYRLWSFCRRKNSMWYNGGVADQPYIQMLEFGVCEQAYGIFRSQVVMTERLLRGD